MSDQIERALKIKILTEESLSLLCEAQKKGNPSDKIQAIEYGIEFLNTMLSSFNISEEMSELVDIELNKILPEIVSERVSLEEGLEFISKYFHKFDIKITKWTNLYYQEQMQKIISEKEN